MIREQVVSDSGEVAAQNLVTGMAATRRTFDAITSGFTSYTMFPV